MISHKEVCTVHRIAKSFLLSFDLVDRCSGREGPRKLGYVLAEAAFRGRAGFLGGSSGVDARWHDAKRV
jgi:hypothetical protein